VVQIGFSWCRVGGCAAEGILVLLWWWRTAVRWFHLRRQLSRHSQNARSTLTKLSWNTPADPISAGASLPTACRRKMLTVVEASHPGGTVCHNRRCLDPEHTGVGSATKHLYWSRHSEAGSWREVPIRGILVDHPGRKAQARGLQPIAPKVRVEKGDSTLPYLP